MSIEYIEMTVRLPLWDSIPAAERATEEDVRNWFDNRGSTYEEEAVQLLRSPRCIVAIKQINRRGLYTPCAHKTPDGVDRCKYHGGPGVPSTRPTRGGKPTRNQLERQLKQAQAELEDLRSGGGAA